MWFASFPEWDQVYTRQSRQSSQIAWGQLTPPKRNPASVSCKSLTATTMPTMPIKNHANSAGQVHTARPVPRQKDLLVGNICLGTADLGATDPMRLGTFDPTFITKCARTREYNANPTCNYARTLHKNIDSEP